jgi:hypothetical protein
MLTQYFQSYHSIFSPANQNKFVEAAVYLTDSRSKIHFEKKDTASVLSLIRYYLICGYVLRINGHKIKKSPTFVPQ